MGDWSTAIARIGKFSTNLAEMLLKGIEPATFARKPNLGGKVIDTNHPAFVYGHLALYPSGALTMLRLDAAKAPKPTGFEELFAAGKECRDDAAGTIYPAMERIVAAYRTNHAVLLEALPGVPDSLLNEVNPREGRSRELFPTIGDAMMFYVGSHPMMHLGQVSAWRRCFGLGSAMG